MLTANQEKLLKEKEWLVKRGAPPGKKQPANGNQPPLFPVCLSSG